MFAREDFAFFVSCMGKINFCVLVTLWAFNYCHRYNVLFTLQRYIKYLEYPSFLASF